MSHLVQGSEEWLNMRRKYIGASDAPVIMQVSPWRTPYSLWLEKTGNGQPQVQNSSMERGSRLEEEARKNFENKTGIKVTPKVKFHKEISYMMASLDGMDEEEKNIVEIKCPNAKDHATAAAGQVPEKYIPQLQHQMEVCAVESAYYYSYNGVEGVSVLVYRDDEYIKKMLKEEKEFWECVESKIAPQYTVKDYEEVYDGNFKKLLQNLHEKYKAYKDLEKEITELKDTCVMFSNNRNLLVRFSHNEGLKLSKRQRKGSIDTKKLAEIEKINLENYRKPDINYWQIESL